MWPYVVIIGETERTDHVYTLKNMHTGDQQQVGVEEMISALGR